MHMQGTERSEAAGPHRAGKWVSAQDVADFYQVNVATVGRWRRAGQIPYLPKPSGKRYLYPQELIEEGARMADWWGKGKNTDAA
jgi:hypothetical protein